MAASLLLPLGGLLWLLLLWLLRAAARRRNSSNQVARSNLQPRRLIVTVPRGVRPGTKFVVVALGERHVVTCPPGVSPGMKVQIFV